MEKLLQPQTLCKCCLNLLKSSDSRFQTNDIVAQIFSKFIENKLEQGFICVPCYEKLVSFDKFQREIKLKHSTVNPVVTRYPVKIHLQKIPLASKDPEKKFQVVQLTPAQALQQKALSGTLQGKVLKIVKIASIPEKTQAPQCSQLPDSGEKLLSPAEQSSQVPYPVEKKPVKSMVSSSINHSMILLRTNFIDTTKSFSAIDFFTFSRRFILTSTKDCHASKNTFIFNTRQELQGPKIIKLRHTLCK